MVITPTRDAHSHACRLAAVRNLRTVICEGKIISDDEFDRSLVALSVMVGRVPRWVVILLVVMFA